MKKEQKTLKQWVLDLKPTVAKKLFGVKAGAIQENTQMMVDENEEWWTKNIQYKMAKGYVKYIEGLNGQKKIVKKISNKKK